VLNHRVILRPESRLRKMTAATVVNDIVAAVPVPMLATEGPSNNESGQPP
jgi:MoxR-like ATPase